MQCCDFDDMVGKQMPFKRAIAVEYGENRAYTGLVRCELHGVHYRFTQLTYHVLDETAIYGLCPITEGNYKALYAAYAKHGKPKWPIWVPATQDQIPRQQYDDLVNLEDTVWAHCKLEAVVAAKHIINSQIRAARTYQLNGHVPCWSELLAL